MAAKLAAVSRHLTRPRPADNYALGLGIARVMMGAGNAAQYQASVFNFGSI
jgi:hypothetical protein